MTECMQQRSHYLGPKASGLVFSFISSWGFVREHSLQRALYGAGHVFRASEFLIFIRLEVW